MITSFLLSSQLAINNKSQIFPLIMKEKIRYERVFQLPLNKNLKLYPEATRREEPKLSNVLSCQMNGGSFSIEVIKSLRRFSLRSPLFFSVSFSDVFIALSVV